MRMVEGGIVGVGMRMVEEGGIVGVGTSITEMGTGMVGRRGHSVGEGWDGSEGGIRDILRFLLSRLVVPCWLYRNGI
jgi:hypothetical protein